VAKTNQPQSCKELQVVIKGIEATVPFYETIVGLKENGFNVK